MIVFLKYWHFCLDFIILLLSCNYFWVLSTSYERIIHYCVFEYIGFEKYSTVHVVQKKHVFILKRCLFITITNYISCTYHCMDLVRDYPSLKVEQARVYTSVYTRVYTRDGLYMFSHSWTYLHYYFEVLIWIALGGVWLKMQVQ